MAITARRKMEETIKKATVEQSRCSGRHRMRMIYGTMR